MKNTKIITGITLFIFFVVTMSILFAGLLNKNKGQSTLGAKSEANPSSIKLTATEVAKHHTSSDCWMIISGNVYDFTSFIPEHPGGLIMVPFCGKDATIAYQTMGGAGRSHSRRADSLMRNYFLGNLNSTVSL